MAAVGQCAAQMGLTYRPSRIFAARQCQLSETEDKTPNPLYNVEAEAVFPATTPASYTNVTRLCPGRRLE